MLATGKKRGRPPGAKSKADEKVIQELVETKCKLAEMALDNLKLRLLQSTDPSERKKITDIIDDLIRKIDNQLSE